VIAVFARREAPAETETTMAYDTKQAADDLARAEAALGRGRRLLASPPSPFTPFAGGSARD
jgi:hypothetical protein